MKKINIIIIALLALLLVFPLSLTGEEIYDWAGILSEDEAQNLADRAAALESKYTITVNDKASNVGVYIVTLPSQYDLTGSDEYVPIYELSEAIYDAWNYGIGAEKNGILLLMDMTERDFDICAHGSAGHYTFTDYGKDKLVDAFSEDFGEDDWYKGFSHYLDEIERQLMWAEKGEPVDVGSSSESLREKIGIPGIIGISLLIGLVLAFIICGYFKSQMKSVRPAASATNFIAGDGIAYTEKLDNYIKTTKSVRVIESKSSSGGTSVNSSGYSHRSGKF